MKPAVAEAVKNAGIKNVVLETDSPFITSKGLEGRNESKNIPFIASYIANILKLDLEEVAEQTTQTAKEIYQIN